MRAMINRRTALVQGLSSLALPVLAQGMVSRGAAAQSSTQDRTDLARIEGYLNGIRTMKARFSQTAPDGDVTQGAVLVQRPGRMRFQYDQPSPFLLVANHGTLIFHDEQLNQTSNIPLNRTPLGILLAEQVALSGDVNVTKLVRLPGQLQVGLVRSAAPGDGTLTLIFADAPLVLRQWIVRDQQGRQTRVTLTNMDMTARFDQALFEYHPSVVGTGGGG